jgi:dTMP kinase
MFIVFEGLDGVGKTTQIRRVAESLRNLGHTVVTTYEPGCTPIGDEVRALLRRYSDLDRRTMTLLYNASRAELAEKVIGPALARGDVVLCDRFFWSTYAYQDEYGAATGITSYAIGRCYPDAVILLDASPESLEGRSLEGNWQDRMSMQDRKRIRNKYLRFAKDDAAWSVIDAALEVATVTDLILKEIVPLLTLRESDFA